MQRSWESGECGAVSHSCLRTCGFANWSAPDKEKGRRKGQDQGRGRDELTQPRENRKLRSINRRGRKETGRESASPRRSDEAKARSNAHTSLCSLPLGPAPSLIAAKQNSFDSYQISPNLGKASKSKAVNWCLLSECPCQKPGQDMVREMGREEWGECVLGPIVL